AAAIPAKFRHAKVQAGTRSEESYCRTMNMWPPKRELMELSLRLKTDVLWLSFQSVVDAFQFHHWQSGNHLRSLVTASWRNTHGSALRARRSPGSKKSSLTRKARRRKIDHSWGVAADRVARSHETTRDAL